MTSLVKDNQEVVSHDVFVSCCRSDCNFIEGNLVLWVFLAVVFFELLKFEVAGPYDLAKV